MMLLIDTEANSNQQELLLGHLSDVEMINHKMVQISHTQHDVFLLLVIYLQYKKQIQQTLKQYQDQCHKMWSSTHFICPSNIPLRHDSSVQFLLFPHSSPVIPPHHIPSLKAYVAIPRHALLPLLSSHPLFDQVFQSDCSTREAYKQGAKDVAIATVSGMNDQQSP